MFDKDPFDRNAYDRTFSEQTEELDLNIQITGTGTLTLDKLYPGNESGGTGDDTTGTFELNSIELLAGEEVVIDTDLLTVVFGNRHDVSSITPESTFFELNPGSNNLIFDTYGSQSLKVTIEWRNRWL